MEAFFCVLTGWCQQLPETSLWLYCVVDSIRSCCKYVAVKKNLLAKTYSLHHCYWKPHFYDYLTSSIIIKLSNRYPSLNVAKSHMKMWARVHSKLQKFYTTKVRNRTMCRSNQRHIIHHSKNKEIQGLEMNKLEILHSKYIQKIINLLVMSNTLPSTCIKPQINIYLP